VSAREQGAFTGEVAAFQLASLNIRHCIVGHSERRQYHLESDALIREKLIRLREQGITPILCIGETLAQREAGETEGLIVSQLEGALQGLELDAGEDLVIAYEPVWAIGTGVTATAQQAGSPRPDPRLAGPTLRFRDGAAHPSALRRQR